MREGTVGESRHQSSSEAKKVVIHKFPKKVELKRLRWAFQTDDEIQQLSANNDGILLFGYSQITHNKKKRTLHLNSLSTWKSIPEPLLLENSHTHDTKRSHSLDQTSSRNIKSKDFKESSCHCYLTMKRPRCFRTGSPPERSARESRRGRKDVCQGEYLPSQVNVCRQRSRIALSRIAREREAEILSLKLFQKEYRLEQEKAQKRLEAETRAKVKKACFEKIKKARTPNSRDNIGEKHKKTDKFKQWWRGRKGSTDTGEDGYGQNIEESGKSGEQKGGKLDGLDKDNKDAEGGKKGKKRNSKNGNDDAEDQDREAGSRNSKRGGKDGEGTGNDSQVGNDANNDSGKGGNAGKNRDGKSGDGSKDNEGKGLGLKGKSGKDRKGGSADEEGEDKEGIGSGSPLKHGKGSGEGGGTSGGRNRGTSEGISGAAAGGASGSIKRGKEEGDDSDGKGIEKSDNDEDEGGIGTHRDGRNKSKVSGKDGSGDKDGSDKWSGEEGWDDSRKGKGKGKGKGKKSNKDNKNKGDNEADKEGTDSQGFLAKISQSVLQQLQKIQSNNRRFSYPSLVGLYVQPEAYPIFWRHFRRGVKKVVKTLRVKRPRFGFRYIFLKESSDYSFENSSRFTEFFHGSLDDENDSEVTLIREKKDKKFEDLPRIPSVKHPFLSRANTPKLKYRPPRLPMQSSSGLKLTGSYSGASSLLQRFNGRRKLKSAQNSIERFRRSQERMGQRHNSRIWNLAHGKLGARGDANLVKDFFGRIADVPIEDLPLSELDSDTPDDISVSGERTSSRDNGALEVGDDTSIPETKEPLSNSKDCVPKLSQSVLVLTKDREGKQSLKDKGKSGRCNAEEDTTKRPKTVDEIKGSVKQVSTSLTRKPTLANKNLHKFKKPNELTKKSIPRPKYINIIRFLYKRETHQQERIKKDDVQSLVGNHQNAFKRGGRLQGESASSSVGKSVNSPRKEYVGQEGETIQRHKQKSAKQSARRSLYAHQGKVSPKVSGRKFIQRKGVGRCVSQKESERRFIHGFFREKPMSPGASEARSTHLNHKKEESVEVGPSVDIDQTKGVENLAVHCGEEMGDSDDKDEAASHCKHRPKSPLKGCRRTSADSLQLRFRREWARSSVSSSFDHLSLGFDSLKQRSDSERARSSINRV